MDLTRSECSSNVLEILCIGMIELDLAANRWLGQEASGTWANHDSTNEPANTTDEVNNPTAGKIQVATGREPASTPGPMDNHGIQKGGDEHGEESVGEELSSLSKSTRHNGRRLSKGT